MKALVGRPELDSWYWLLDEMNSRAWPAGGGRHLGRQRSSARVHRGRLRVAQHRLGAERAGRDPRLLEQRPHVRLGNRLAFPPVQAALHAPARVARVEDHDDPRRGGRESVDINIKLVIDQDKVGPRPDFVLVEDADESLVGVVVGPLVAILVVQGGAVAAVEDHDLVGRPGLAGPGQLLEGRDHPGLGRVGQQGDLARLEADREQPLAHGLGVVDARLQAVPPG